MSQRWLAGVALAITLVVTACGISDCPISLSDIHLVPPPEGLVMLAHLRFSASNSSSRPVRFVVHVEWSDGSGNVLETGDYNLELGGGQNDTYGADTDSATAGNVKNATAVIKKCESL